MFADDTNILSQGSTEYEIQERLNADLERAKRASYNEFFSSV